MSAATSNPEGPAEQGWTQQHVRAAVDAQFAAQNRDAVLRDLARYQGHSIAGRARVQLAIIHRAQGDAARIGRLVQYALTGFRAFPVHGRGRRERDLG